MATELIARFRELFELDLESGVLLWKVNRRGGARAGDIAGSAHGEGYRTVCVDGRPTLEHRVIFAMVNGYLPDQVDHINGIRDDNRPVNLRAATHFENLHNARTPRNNSSGVKGVTFEPRTGKWQARIQSGGVRHSLGCFDRIEDASQAVQASRNQLHGEFARHV